ncbi:MAG: type II secretion system F family protein [Betaproteobacteria bacterium]|nr:type II secretion system F family protein [Betaproteobacteria bacterium]MDE2423528.1 type II secretion system F family protein [Betaproteobacteria bacterium]
MTVLTLLFFCTSILSLVIGLILIKITLLQHKRVSHPSLSLPFHLNDVTDDSSQKPLLLSRLFTFHQPNVSTEQWCRFFDLLCFSLKSSLTLRQALGSLVTRVNSPLSHGIDQVLHQLELGASVIDALKHWHNNLQDPLLKRFIFIVELHELTGGDIVRLLQQWTPQLRQAEQVVLEVKQSTKEARASGIILSLLTPSIALITGYFHPQLWRSTLNSQQGIQLLLITLLIWLVGCLWTYQLTHITRSK